MENLERAGVRLLLLNLEVLAATASLVCRRRVRDSGQVSLEFFKIDVSHAQGANLPIPLHLLQSFNVIFSLVRELVEQSFRFLFDPTTLLGDSSDLRFLEKSGRRIDPCLV